jgi:predicted HD superfamily hydrolase involved in NAD metabolism
VPASIADQIVLVRKELESRPPGLVRHIERVVAEAASLATYWSADPERCALAAWGHDLFRALSADEQLRMAAEVGLDINDADRAAPVVLHGPTAAVVLRERLAIRDEEVLSAVRDHTLGRAEMPMIAKIILLADKFEPNKRSKRPVMKEIRRLARRDIDLALMCWSDWNWVDQAEHGWGTHPQHWLAREHWLKEKLQYGGARSIDRAYPAATEV